MTSPTSPSPAHICTRFAPSPSGHLHVGGARTALFCWVYAKARGGKFILRIEDTDQKRSSEAASLGFLEDLKWLGITWDEGPELDGLGGGPNGPYFQSQRLDIYNDCIERLIASGHAYRAFENPEELNAARQKAQAEKRNYRYDRAALKLSPETIKQYIDEGRPHVVRFRVPDEEGGGVVVHDQVRGEVVTNFTELDDFVIRKADGFPMYNFAVVVDDEMMQVTHIIRAQEHLSNTPRHILLQQALGFRTPVYAHVSIITNPDGSKMSKRDKDKALRAEVKKRTLASSPVDAATGHPIILPDRWMWWLKEKDHQLDLGEAEALAKSLNITLPEINVDDFRRNGYLPEVMINYLALLGWNPGGGGAEQEKFDLAFLKERFDFDRVIKSPAAFDRNKLLAFNADAIGAMPPEEFEQKLREHCERYHPGLVEKLGDKFALFARTNQSRSKTLEQQIGPSRFFIMPDDAIVYEKGKAIDDALIKTVAGSEGASVGAGAGGGLHHLEAIIPVLEGIAPESWKPAIIETAVKQYAEAYAQNKMGMVAQPLRIAVTGGTVSPAIFDTLAILGRTSTLNRIRRCITMHTPTEV